VPWEEPGSSAIVVLTPEAEPLAGAFYREQSNAGRDGMTPHVTLLVPFVPAQAMNEDIDQRLRRVIGRFEAFDYHLPRFECFERCPLSRPGTLAPVRRAGPGAHG
jgi:2'-5' RNA ligase superfamily